MDHLPLTRAGAPILYGRRPEREELDRLLERARTGHGGALLLHGGAGIGKTALLRSLRARAEGFRVLEAGAVEFESGLRFAAVHQLVAPLLDRLDRMPPHLRGTVEAAFAAADGAPAWFTMGLALHALVRRYATDGPPLLCLVDDAQWLDPPSARALDLMARGLSSARAAVVLALREPAERPEIEELPRLRLGPLPEDEAAALFDAHVPVPLDARVRRRILAEARGNPRALLQAAGTAIRSGGYPGALRTPAADVPPVAELPEPGRTVLLAAAADPTGDPALLSRALARLGLSEADVRPLCEAGLLECAEVVRFPDPAVRSAVYRAASTPARRRAHQALADATGPDADAGRRAWHRAMAALGPDEQVAVELETGAGQARVSGGAVAAAAFLERAVSLTEDPRRLAGRALAAADAQRRAGGDDVALTLIGLVDAATPSPAERTRAETLRARIRYTADRDEDALDRLLTAIAADPSQAYPSLRDALAITIAAGRDATARQRRTLTSAVSALPPSTTGRALLAANATRTARPPSTAGRALLAAIASRIGGGDALSPLRQALDGRLPAEGPLPAIAAVETWDFPRWRRLAEARVRAGTAAGAPAELCAALDDLAVARLHAGELAAAEEHLRTGRSIARALGAGPLTTGELLCAAWRGDQDVVAELRRRAGPEARDGRQVTFGEIAQAVLLNGLGRYDAACEVLRPAVELDEPGVLPFVAMEFVEAAVRSERPGLAAPVAARVRAHARATGSGWAAGLASWCRALLSDGPAAEEAYRDAVRRLEAPQPSAVLARARLSYGEWLRRQGRRSDAGEHLRAAHASFASMGAAAFAGRAERELAAIGRPRRRQGREPAPARLTPQEESIARLAAAGTTSKEIGRRLFLSPRTVDAHLRSVFRKLDISSRRQLREMRF
ncbi:helix-turn-helix domain-containing protein [Nonomuraea sp. FMUSA5-5]|uniref:Helix-turn-helix domain-containing protein n=1 Tax=Nonomuraea composti TaxID=2720023 RepID=A0ABX1BBG4_9ACTN|nr:LuxR family transcriptional regulator [Nonomuraea sp. FMUSA5-5]NJP95124.1 helix-turn-helix domain-containing protein [Nonomuraea sp. FMUSA5-5]